MYYYNIFLTWLKILQLEVIKCQIHAASAFNAELWRKCVPGIERTQLTFTCVQSTIEILEKDAEYVRHSDVFIVNFEHTSHLVDIDFYQSFSHIGTT